MQPSLSEFKRLVLCHYRAHGRFDLAWRKTTNPYHIAVSEIMLQQTQVVRVQEFYAKFLNTFPTWDVLARAPTPRVLSAWSGLGYNRRALFLKRIADLVVRDYDGALPRTLEALQKLPGIGPNTAASIMAFAYNIPCAFIETNIRTVYLHHFFAGKKNISDRQLLKLIFKTVDRKNPRRWYWALMDYGSSLKKASHDASRLSLHYSKQSKFNGSVRQLRGQILRLLLKNKQMTAIHLHKKYPAKTVNQIANALDALVHEKFIVKNGDFYSLVA